MNFTRVALGSVVILASASSVSWVARQPVFAKANIAELPIRKEFFTVIPEFKSFMLQETPKKVFPKVDPKDEIPLPEGPGKNTTIPRYRLPLPPKRIKKLMAATSPR